MSSDKSLFDNPSPSRLFSSYHGIYILSFLLPCQTKYQENDHLVKIHSAPVLLFYEDKNNAVSEIVRKIEIRKGENIVN